MARTAVFILIGALAVYLAYVNFDTFDPGKNIALPNLTVIVMMAFTARARRSKLGHAHQQIVRQCVPAKKSSELRHLSLGWMTTIYQY